jgi:hypothetical protein
MVHELESRRRKTINLNSTDIVYSEHGYDECFEYVDGSGRVPEGLAVGYIQENPIMQKGVLTLFKDIKYSQYDHDYWDNHELEHDVDRIVIG